VTHVITCQWGTTPTLSYHEITDVEFLEIEGCAEGRYLFVRKSKGEVRDTRGELTIFAVVR
jgi:hypothetical protein